MYNWLSITKESDYDKLARYLTEEFGGAQVIRRLRDTMTDAVRGVLIESDYTDKDYRSTYYNYYAKKGRNYRADCVRLHFFDETIEFNEATLDLRSKDERLEDHYFGYIVVRPTYYSTIGRSLLSPNIRRGARGSIIHAKYKVHLLGHRLEVSGFPSMEQHSDISVCAHVACWSVMRHYSERYPQHKELLLHDITTLARDFDPGGVAPANGLVVAEAERIFQAAGTYPLVIAQDTADLEKFYRQLIAYLESGFPLFVAVPARTHSVAAIGYAWRDDGPRKIKREQHAYDQADAIVVVDDNHLPYLPIPTNAKAPSPTDYCATDFDCFVVPLPEKVHFSAEVVDEFVGHFHTTLSQEFALPSGEDLVTRYFITTASGLRDYVRRNASQFDADLLQVVMQLRTAQFIWVVEYASKAQWQAGHIAARAILDASASPNDPLPVWFAHNAEGAIIFDRSSQATPPLILSWKPTGVPLGRMERNLRPVRAK